MASPKAKAPKAPPPAGTKPFSRVVKKMITPSPTASASKKFGHPSHGLTPGDQFNIMLFHTSFVEKEWDNVVDCDDEATRTAHVVAPVISVTGPLSNLNCLYKVGGIYRVTSDYLLFFTTEDPTKLWPEEWYAKDFYLQEGDTLMFLGVVQYNIKNTINNKENCVYALKFLANEKLVQYPVFANLSYTLNFSDSLTKKQSIIKESLESALMTALKESLELVIC